jgi:hypothetical protein
MVTFHDHCHSMTTWPNIHPNKVVVITPVTSAAHDDMLAGDVVPVMEDALDAACMESDCAASP